MHLLILYPAFQAEEAVKPSQFPHTHLPTGSAIFFLKLLASAVLFAHFHFNKYYTTIIYLNIYLYNISLSLSQILWAVTKSFTLLSGTCQCTELSSQG